MNAENIIKELKPIDYVIEEKTITLLFDENKILILKQNNNYNRVLQDGFLYAKLW